MVKELSAKHGYDFSVGRKVGLESAEYAVVEKIDLWVYDGIPAATVTAGKYTIMVPADNIAYWIVEE